MNDDAAPQPLGGDGSTPHYQHAHDCAELRKEVDMLREQITPKWKTILGWAGTAAVALVAAVLWLTSALGAKASGDALMEVTKRVEYEAVRMASVEADNAWIKATLYQLAQHEGVPASPPPTPH